jgi:hypothetical protein
MTEYEIKSRDNLYKIVAREFSLHKKSDIMNMVKKVTKDNNIKNPNKIYAGQKINLKDEVRLNSVSVFNPETNQETKLKDTTGNSNYYRTNCIFGDIATKPDEYEGQNYTPSNLREITQATPEVEDVTIDIKGFFTSETARDAQAYDIAAKPAGVGGYSGMNGTDAYNLFLQVNADDFTTRESEYKGKVETKAYLDPSKSDGKIKVFSSEIIDGKEYLALRDNDGAVHYFDKENKLNEVHINQKEETTETNKEITSEQ